MKKILHATDLGPHDAVAFAHALRLAIDAKAKLYLLHVADREGGDHWSQFPHVRETLGRWGLLDPRKPPQAIEAELGLHVAKVSVRASNLRQAIAQFAEKHDCDLLVLWTHDQRSPMSWLGGGAIAVDIARSAGMQSLFLPGAASGFVDVATGRTKLDTVLVPVDDQLDCTDALDRIEATLRLFAPDARLRRLHIGTNPPRLPTAGAREFMLRQGPVVQTITSVAHETGAGLIAMPTAGRHGVFDALRGSTTERVLREAGLPILAAPV